MKNTFGNNLKVTIFGESHGAAVGAVIDGITPGLEVDNKFIEKLLERRRPNAKTDTARSEKDPYQIVSGVFEGKTTGTPITIVIPNGDTRSKDYQYGVARPSHADYSAFCKFHGFEDYRGGGHFSGRITAGLVATGGILIPALEKKGIRIGTHILKCGPGADRQFENIERDIELLQNSEFPVLEESEGQKMTDYILEAKGNLDSVGGITQTIISGLVPGLGEPWFDSVESMISHAVFSLGGVKGIEFGMGFEFANQTASSCNDSFRMNNGSVITVTNNNGGINGGITNGMPVLFQCVVKPTPSIAQNQQTVDFKKNQNAELVIKGRHDPAIIRRICPVLDSVTAIVVADLLIGRFGTDFLFSK